MCVTGEAADEQRQPRLNHIAELDGARGIAVLAILLLHFYDPVIAAKPFGSLVASVLPLCAGGVDLFFVLSGFLITRILVASKGASNYFQAFYARRILRIFPLYFHVVAIFFLLLPVAHRHHVDEKSTGLYAAWYLLFAQNWMQALRISDGAQLAHFWTLAIEEQFYLLWPATVWLLTTDQLRRTAIGIIACVEVVRGLLWLAHVSSVLIYFNTVTRLDALALGALLSLSPTTRQGLFRAAPYVMPIAAIASLFLPEPYFPLLLLIICGCTVALAASGRGRILRSRFLQNIGRYSFAMYVFHYLLHGALVPLAKRVPPLPFALAAIIGGTCASYATAWLSWRLIEQPALQLKRFFRYNHAGQQHGDVTIPSTRPTKLRPVA